jgi:hypothetical protein
MKKSILFYVSFCLSIVLHAQQSRNIDLTVAGSLSDSLSANDRTIVSNLTLTGTVDARDFKTIRDSIPSLEHLNLEQVSIVSYHGSKGTIYGDTSYVANVIPAYAFNIYSSKLSSVILPISFTSLDNTVFMNFKGSISVDSYNQLYSTFDGVLFDKNKTTIFHCYKKGSYTIPSTVTSISNNCFSGCDSLKTLNIPASLIYIGKYVFSDLSQNAPNIIVDPLNQYFSSSDSVLFNKDKTVLIFCHKEKTGTYAIPTSVKEIRFGAFAYCSNLKSISMPEGLITIDSLAFMNCGNWVGMLNIPSTVEYIRLNAFLNCWGLMGQVILPSKLKHIGNQAFENCWNISDEMAIPSTVTYIGQYAFYACKKLSAFRFSSSLIEIGDCAFCYDTFNAIYIENEVPITFGTNNILAYFVSNVDLASTCTLYVPFGTKSSYQLAPIWKDFVNIQEMPEFKLSANSVFLPATSGSIATVDVTSNTSWLAVSTQTWLTVLPSKAKTGNGTITFLASANVGPERSAVVLISSTGLLPSTFIVTQADSIAIVQNIVDLSITTESVVNDYFFANYFDYGSSTDISYSVISDNIAVVKPTVSRINFGLIPYSAGTANITVTAKTKSGKIANIIFKVTVTSTATITCPTLVIQEIITPVLCNGESTGAIQLSVTGGTNPYRYKWSNTKTDNVIESMPAGTYSVIVTDVKGCVGVKSFTISESSKIEIDSTIHQPQCSNSDGSISLSVSGGISPYIYKWNNGTINTSITGKEAGVYSVTVTDSKSCEKHVSYQLNNVSGPQALIDTIIGSKCNESVGIIQITASGGTAPYSYLWNDNQKSKDRIGVRPGDYSVVISDASGCKTTLKANVPSKTFIQPSISLTTVSSGDGKNLIVWQKEDNDAICKYNIYREGISAGKYEKVGQCLSSKTSIFEDSLVNPLSQSWRYKIAAEDYCGKETNLSHECKTMHLQKNLGLQSEVNLDWDDYEGTDFSTYVIYRQTAAKGVEEIAKVPASISRYTDVDNIIGNKSYFVGIELPEPIDVSKPKLKSDSGPFSQSLSNLAESKLIIASEQSLSTITISPNPVKTSTIISINSQKTFSITVFDGIGRIVAFESGIGTITLNCSQILSGAYIVRIQSGNDICTKSLIVEK